MLFREWDPSTFEFSDLKEVRISKNAHANKVAEWLVAHIFTDIELENLYVTKIHNIRGFKRGDLAVKAWRKLKT